MSGSSKVSFVRDLETLGFSGGAIVEAIVTTCTRRELRPNAAPMGIQRIGLKLVIRPYSDTVTYRNLRENPYAVINIAQKPELFYRTAFKERDRCPIRWFTWARAVNAPRLKEADAFVEVEVGEFVDEGGRGRFACEVKLTEFKQVTPKAYSRCASAMVEAVIWGAKARSFLARGGDNEARRCLQKVKECQEVIKRVDPKSRYLALIEEMLSKLAS